MSTRNDGGPAFPYGEVHTMESAAPPYGSEVTSINKPGMTLRQYYAAKAMQGMMVNGWLPSPSVDWSKSRYELIAEEAFKMADAMIAEVAA